MKTSEIRRVVVDPWELPSNRGWDIARGELRGVFVREQALIFLSSIHLTGRYWAAVDGLERSHTAEEYSVELSQVEIARGDLLGARTALNQWVRAPFDLELKLSAMPDHRLSMSLRPEPGTVSTIDKPVCRFRFSTAHLTGECAWVVDQSCIRIFVEGIESWLKQTE